MDVNRESTIFVGLDITQKYICKTKIGPSWIHIEGPVYFKVVRAIIEIIEFFTSRREFFSSVERRNFINLTKFQKRHQNVQKTVYLTLVCLMKALFWRM